MVKNTKKVILKILNNPKKLKKDDLTIIKNISDNYPYFSPVRILYLLFSRYFLSATLIFSILIGSILLDKRKKSKIHVSILSIF